VSWSKRFDVPIMLPDGKSLSTLADARQHLLALPKARHEAADVTTAIEAMLMAAEGLGPVMHANVGIARVINGRPKIPEPQQSKEKHWGRRRPARGQ
jgi:hypothetical protein